jgi:hypothetical protein
MATRSRKVCTTWSKATTRPPSRRPLHSILGAVIGGLDPGEQFGVQGITRAEIERRFTPAWTLLSSDDAPEMERFGKGHYSLLQPRDT